MGFQEKVSLEWALQDSDSGRCLTSTGATWTETWSLEGKVCVLGNCLFHLARAQGTQRGILEEGSRKGCEVLIAKGFE